jgi:hypothetical protein
VASGATQTESSLRMARGFRPWRRWLT